MKAAQLKIKSHIHIVHNRIIWNNELIYSGRETDFPSFIKKAYKDIGTDYPKFFKMDNLSKLGFLAADILLGNTIREPGREHNIALVFSNNAASLDTDRKHQKSIQDKENFFPSPAVFVYTLPNIVLGEISIKHMLYSENSFFIFSHFNADYLYDYANSLIETGKATEVLCGWVDYDHEDYEAFVYLVSAEGTTEHTKEEILKLYRTK
ncbi:MAG TPA: hypothetical protein VKZ93_09290 [Arenibacter sp.]|nr:hypothetical protein [Arenibacter sp.]